MSRDYQKRKDDVWNKGGIVDDKDPNKYRSDKTGNIIYYGSYGKDTSMGWHIDHLNPRSLGGTNHLNNLQPLQASQNKSKSNQRYYDYDSVDNRGLTRYDLINTNVDKRSSLVKNDELLLNYNGTVDKRSEAVKNGDVIVNKDGSISKNSRAVKNGNVFLKE